MSVSEGTSSVTAFRCSVCRRIIRFSVSDGDTAGSGSRSSNENSSDSALSSSSKLV